MDQTTEPQVDVPSSEDVAPGQTKKKKADGGCVIWEGPSLFDGQPIVVIATGLRKKGSSANSKTGDAIQTYIILRDVDPYDALRNGADASICGDCKLKPGAGGKGRSCFVHIGMVHNVWEKYKRGGYPPLAEAVPYLRQPKRDPLAGRIVRVGYYGDPAAVPFEVWELVMRRAAGWIGYTHQWRRCDPRLKKSVMASVDTPQERKEAARAGWRSFRTLLPGEKLLAGEIVCPATKEAKAARNEKGLPEKTVQCLDCMLCDGKKGHADRRRSITSIVHGPKNSPANYHRMRASLPIVQ